MKLEPLSRFHDIRSDAEQISYTLWFTCKHLIRKVKGVRIGMREANRVRLPQEIVDHIVERISDDRPTLFACTHLSRTWCIAARTHLHRTFTVSDPAGFKSVSDLKRMGTIHLVHRMVATRKVNQVDFLLPKELTRLNAFTHLQELDLKYLDVGELLLRLHEGCDILRSTVRTLALRYPTGSIKRIICFITLFSKLENLTVDSINRVDTYDSQVPVIGCSPPLTGRLRLSGITEQQFIYDLASLQGGVRFRTVDLRFCREVQEIIDGCAETMERLTWHSSDFLDIKNLKFPRCDSLRHVEVDFNSVVHAFPDHPFYEFVSAIPSPRLETCLILSYDSDLDKLSQTFQATRKPRNKSIAREEEKLKRDVKITFGLDIEEAKAEDYHSSIGVALDCAIGNGVFDFLNSAPNLEVHLRVWS